MFRKKTSKILTRDDGRLFREVSANRTVDFLVEFDYFLLIIVLAITVVGMIFL